MKRIFYFLIIALASQILLANPVQAGIDFYIDPLFHSQSLNKIAASLKLTGQNSYFFVEDAYFNSLNADERSNFDLALQNLSQEFDAKIYPKMRETFGEEWSPGIDQDRRITILATQMIPEKGGYFRFEDEYPNSVFPNSNQREMIYLNAVKITHPHVKSYLAHEFQHLINFYQKTKLKGLKEEKWLDEARSEYAPTFLGHNSNFAGSYLQTRVSDFLAPPSDSLLSWQDRASDFGQATIFIHFLVDHYGEAILAKILQNDKIGRLSVEEAIKSFGKTESFEEFFTRWTVANYINNPLKDEGLKYTYLSQNLFYGNLHVLPSTSYSMYEKSEIATSFLIEDWSANWIRFVPGRLGRTENNILKIEFSGSQNYGNFKVPYVITEISGEIKVKFFELKNQQGIVYIPDFGTSVLSAVLIPSNQFESLLDSPPASYFNIRASLVSKINPNDFSDGTTIRAKNDPKVFVIKQGFRRWIQSPEIFNNYGHLSWQKIVEVDSGILANYQESFLIRKVGDYRVFEADSSGKKRWLNMTAKQFEASGRKWEAVYEVNDYEFNWFRTGSEIRG